VSRLVRRGRQSRVVTWLCRLEILAGALGVTGCLIDPKDYPVASSIRSAAGAGGLGYGGSAAVGPGGSSASSGADSASQGGSVDEAGAGGAPAVEGGSGGDGGSGFTGTCGPNAAACPPGCLGFTWQNVDYMACRTPASTWSDAEQYCQMQSMHLAEVESAAENSAIFSHASGLGASLWLGASDFNAKGKLAWLDGTVIATLQGTTGAPGVPVAGVYQDFGEGQPSSFASQACVGMNIPNGGTWFAGACNNSCGFVCEAVH
jgi:hypothetical protein